MLRTICCRYPGCYKKPSGHLDACRDHLCIICENNVQNSMWANPTEPSRGKCGYCGVCSYKRHYVFYGEKKCIERSVKGSRFCIAHKCTNCYSNIEDDDKTLCILCVECYVCGTPNFEIKRCVKHNCVVDGCPRRAHLGDETLCLFHATLPNCEYCCDRKYSWGKKIVCIRSHCLWLKKNMVDQNQYRVSNKIVFEYPKKISATHKRNAIAEHIADVLGENNIPRDVSNIVAQYRIK